MQHTHFFEVERYHRYIVDMATAAYYPVNDTGRSPAERAYLQELTDIAAKQPLEEDKRQEVRNITIIFTVITVLIVALRFISRLKIKAPFWTDDWLTLAALMLLFGNAAFNFVMVEQGVGLHSGRLNLPQLQALNKVRLSSRTRPTFVPNACDRLLSGQRLYTLQESTRTRYPSYFYTFVYFQSSPSEFGHTCSADSQHAGTSQVSLPLLSSVHREQKFGNLG